MGSLAVLLEGDQGSGYDVPAEMVRQDKQEPQKTLEMVSTTMQLEAWGNDHCDCQDVNI